MIFDKIGGHLKASASNAQKLQLFGKSTSVFDAYKMLGKLFYTVGFHAEYALIVFKRLAIKAKGKALEIMWHGASVAAICIKGFAMLFLDDVFAIIAKVINYFVGCIGILKTKQHVGVPKVFMHTAAYSLSGLLKNKHLLWQLFSKLIVLAAAGVFFYTVHTVMNYEFALDVQLNGQSLGFVESEMVYEEARQLVQDRIHTSQKSNELVFSPGFTISACDKTKVISANTLADKMVQASGDDIQNATGIIIDGVLLGVTTEKDAIQNILSEMKKPFQDESKPNLKVEFVKNVQLSDGIYFNSSLVPLKNLSDMLTGMEEGEKRYLVKSGDTPSTIAQAFEMPLKNLYQLNPHIDPSLNPKYSMPIGDDLLVSKAVNFLEIKTIERSVIRVPIKHEVIKKNSSDLSWGVQKTITEGADGIEERTLDIVKIDGITVEENLIESKILQQPIAKEIVVGTKLSASGQTGAVGTGTYLWPVPRYRSVSRGFGGGGHRGLDITASAGTPIIATDNAIVEFAGKGRGSLWSYGLYVKLRHSNGLVTIYAHCSSLNVSTGQYVSQGQVIAGVGNTGRSSGNHLHFEVQSGGRPIEPYNFVRRP